MAEIVYGEEEFSEALRNLVNLLQAPEFGGTLYIGYPILTNIEGTVRVDALYVSPDAGVVIFDFENLGVTPDQVDAIVELQRSQDRYFAAIHAKLLETPELLSRRKLLVPITIISVNFHSFCLMEQLFRYCIGSGGSESLFTATALFRRHLMAIFVRSRMMITSRPWRARQSRIRLMRQDDLSYALSSTQIPLRMIIRLLTCI